MYPFTKKPWSEINIVRHEKLFGVLLLTIAVGLSKVLVHLGGKPYRGCTALIEDGVDLGIAIQVEVLWAKLRQ